MTRFKSFIALILCCIVLAFSLAFSSVAQNSASPTPILILSGTGSCCSGATTETNVVSLKVPANTIGAIGAIDIKCQWTYPNSANNKTLVVRFSTAAGITGTAYASTVATTTVTTSYEVIIRNTATNAQVSYGGAPTAPYGITTTPPLSSAIDTTVDAFLNIDATTASGAETITLNGCLAMVMRSP